MNEKVKKVFETFVKKAILLVINSRMKDNKESKGKFSELDLNQSGIRKSSIISQIAISLMLMIYFSMNMMCFLFQKVKEKHLQSISMQRRKRKKFYSNVGSFPT